MVSTLKIFASRYGGALGGETRLGQQLVAAAWPTALVLCALLIGFAQWVLLRRRVASARRLIWSSLLAGVVIAVFARSLWFVVYFFPPAYAVPIVLGALFKAATIERLLHEEAARVAALPAERLTRRRAGAYR